MKKLEVKGGRKISGTIKISGSKNATLPILASTILTDKKIIIKNIPIVKDVETMAELLRTIGSAIKLDQKNKKIEIFNKRSLKTFAPYHLLKTMRAGVLVLGPLLAKYRTAKVALPGGCAIGTRPIDLHLNGLKKMGASIKINDGYVIASAKKGLKGCLIKFPKISVGATENLLIAACFAQGETKLRNCALEPEIDDLINFLKKLGCKIKRIGKRSINVFGKEKLKSVTHEVIFDRIEAGTYIIAAALTKGKLKIKKINPKIIKTEINLLQKMGVKILKKKNQIIVSRPKKLKSISVVTKPYPGFPTDLQAQWMALMTIARGGSKIKENIYKDRFSHVSELMRFGAEIRMDDNVAYVEGDSILKSAPVMSTDIRASASLILAALSAKGESSISRIYHIDRGYEKIENKIKSLGGDIERFSS